MSFSSLSVVTPSGIFHVALSRCFAWQTRESLWVLCRIVSYLRSFEIVDSAEGNLHPASAPVLVCLHNILLRKDIGIRNKLVPEVFDEILFNSYLNGVKWEDKEVNTKGRKPVLFVVRLEIK